MEPVICIKPTMHAMSSSELAVSRSPEELDGRPIQSATFSFICIPRRVHCEHLSTSRISKASSTAGRLPPWYHSAKSPNHERFDDALIEPMSPHSKSLVSPVSGVR